MRTAPKPNRYLPRANCIHLAFIRPQRVGKIRADGSEDPDRRGIDRPDMAHRGNSENIDILLCNSLANCPGRWFFDTSL